MIETMNKSYAKIGITAILKLCFSQYWTTNLAKICVLRTYAPVVTLPVAIIIGAVGYTLENRLSRKTTPSIESVEERRRKRQLQLGKVLISPEPIEDPSTIMPRTILDRNLSPSLMDTED
ncbi:small integral membrane protein 12 [Homalodisca vitripennis]|uniref:small integral membrane protein 12 n=1 Tax=Homalodisca vitripennis TaxID=197043 RepID=UPI001EEA3ADE|nr:small integral membrane protein 12 [Homalodisca vitripennis]